jgi:molybdenum-dependent DNA-binding transcriptional regulator ModE
MITGKAEKLILALLEHGSHEKAAAALGWSASTVWRWLQKPEFKEQYREARVDAYSRGMARLQNAVNPAGTTILRIMVDSTARSGDRLKAAVAVLNLGPQAFLMDDMIRRLKLLEDAKDD